MAATDKPYRNQRTLDIVFAVSCILMLLSTLWMLVADYNREFKAVQRTFRDVESVLNERQMLGQLPDPAEVEKLQKEIVEKRAAVTAARDAIKTEDQRLTAERDTSTATYQSIKADFDSISSLYNIDVEERDQPGISREVRKERAERVAARKQKLDDLQTKLNEAQAKVDDIADKYKTLTKPVTKAENELAEAEDALKKATSSFDRFAKLTVQKDWGLGDSFRALPIIDGFESPTKIKQIVLNDLPIEYGSFKYVTRYDRCTSCHLAVDRATFDHDSLFMLTLDEKEAFKALRDAVQAASNDLAALVPALSDPAEQGKRREALATLDGAVSNLQESLKKARQDLVGVTTDWTNAQTAARGNKAALDASIRDLDEAMPASDRARLEKALAELLQAQAAVDKAKADGHDPAKEVMAAIGTATDNWNKAIPEKKENKAALDTAKESLDKALTTGNTAQLEKDLADFLVKRENARAEVEKQVGFVSGQSSAKVLSEVLNALRDSEIPSAKEYGPLDAAIASVQKANSQLAQIVSFPEKLETARRIMQARKEKGDDIGFDPGNMSSHVRTVNLTPGQITEFSSHPRLDLFVDSNSPHPMEKFGCTICHAGQGSATDFLLSDHMPATARQAKDWETAYHWRSDPDWEFPMLSNRFTESSCLKCHHEVTDLIRQGSKEEAPKLLRGFNLVRENGCFGCHEIPGIKSGREVGPDMRLEPTPPLDWLTATDQDRAKVDPTNPPGQYRKVGPSLRRIVEKTNEEWARRWIQSPRGFRADTRMPHFYNLSTSSPDVLPEDQKDYPAAEIHSIAHYLFTESGKEFTESADHKSTTAQDAYRLGMEDRLKELQGMLKEAQLDDKDRKELRDLTRRLADVALLSVPVNSGSINDRTGRLRQAQERIIELYEKMAKKSEGGPGDKLSAQETKDMAAAKKDLDALAGELEALGNPVPVSQRIVDSEGEPVADALPEADKNDLAKHQAEGRRLFSERGCLACHVHDGVRQKGPDGAPAIGGGTANFGPDLSRIVAKLTPQKGGAANRRRWLVQWVLNPNIHSPRTRMPVTHLTVPQACDVADWLLSQEVKPEDLAGWEKDPKEPDAKTLISLARVYLAKAPGMTGAEVETILPKDEDDLSKVHGYSEEGLKFIPRDADERALQGPITKDKLEWYVGRKAVSRLGCYACHDVPGFETAKPIGTALNDWGKKDPARLAFEEADSYVRGHYNIAEARNLPGHPNQADPTWRSKDGKPPYERIYFEALENHTREGFLHEKLEDPRSYDYNRIRTWDDRLRMPQFKFGRSRRHAGETDEAYAARQDLEEADAREAVMTFILGLVAEPIPLKFVNASGPDRQAEVKGRKVLDQFNCAGCHQVRPGVYEFKPTTDTLDALERVYQSYETNGAKKDHVFPGHNGWTGVGSPWPDRLAMHGTQAHVQDDESANRPMLNVRLADALQFTNNDHVTRNIPAGMTAKVVPTDIINQSQPLGGAFVDLLVPYLEQSNSTLFGNKPDEARAVLPPPLSREGERVQPKWLYQFLLNPQPVRPQEKMKLRMPRFNMSGEDATALVNYFGGADKLSNPGAGITSPYLRIEEVDQKYWRDQTNEYLNRLGKDYDDPKKVDQRAKDLLTQLKAGVQLRLDAVKAAAMTAQGDDKARKEQEAKDLQATMDKWDKQIKDGDFADIVKEWKSREAYAADAYRLVAANPNLCTKCHSIGSLKIENANGPDLSIAFERLRPEWTQQWISNPERMFAYSPTMPQNFPKDSVDYKEYLAGDPRERARAARDVLMDLPRLDNLPANRATRAAISGGK